MNGAALFYGSIIYGVTTERTAQCPSFLCALFIKLSSSQKQTHHSVLLLVPAYIGQWERIGFKIFNDCVLIIFRFLGRAPFQWRWLSKCESSRKPGANPHVHPGGWPGENAARSTTWVRKNQLQGKLSVQQVGRRRGSTAGAFLIMPWCGIQDVSCVIKRVFLSIS